MAKPSEPGWEDKWFCQSKDNGGHVRGSGVALQTVRRWRHREHAAQLPEVQVPGLRAGQQGVRHQGSRRSQEAGR